VAIHRLFSVAIATVSIAVLAATVCGSVCAIRCRGIRARHQPRFDAARNGQRDRPVTAERSSRAPLGRSGGEDAPTF